MQELLGICVNIRLKRMGDLLLSLTLQVLQSHDHSAIRFCQGHWTQKMEISLIALTGAVVTIDQNFYCLANYGHLEKLYNILCLATNLGSLAMKKKLEICDRMKASYP